MQTNFIKTIFCDKYMSKSCHKMNKTGIKMNTTGVKINTMIYKNIRIITNSVMVLRFFAFLS